MGAELFAGAGGFDQVTATVGGGVEFSRTFSIVADPDPFVELDVAASSFSFTLTNPASTGCPVPNPDCLYNAGLDAIELTGLDDPDGAIVDVVQTASTFPAGAITGLTFGPNSVRVEFDQPVIPGFGTVWSASWNLVVPEPSSLALLALGLGALGASRRGVLHQRPRC